jgi:CubicO group peptidase (beta-lactamase class C family)
MADGSVSGFTDSKFDAVAEAFEANLSSGADLGASFCATIEGETVVDLWGGWADEARTRPWEKDTIVNVYSTTKTMTALCALMIADRGELDFDAPVARYWPEFAANGKAGVKVSHLMAHSAGLSGWKEKISADDIYDWEKATALLAAQAPFWEPGTAPGYHGMTQGYLVGEVVRRITGRSLGTFFREEVAEPLGADFHIGFGPELDNRIADLIPPPPGGAIDDGAPSELMLNMAGNPPIDPLATRTRAWRAAEIPAAGGHGNARSVAQIHAILANGGVAQGKRFLSEAGCRKALEPQVEGMDLVLGLPAKYGMGFGLPKVMLDLPNPNSMFWGGYGGSLILIDMDARTTFGYAMNRMGLTTMGDARAMAMAKAMWAALGL